MSSLAHLGSNITLEELMTLSRLAKEALREISLSERPYFMEALHLVQDDLLTSAYSIFWI